MKDERGRMKFLGMIVGLFDGIRRGMSFLYDFLLSSFRLHPSSFSFIVFLLASFSLEGTETKPWFGNALEFEFRPSFTYRHYDHVDVGGSTVRSSSDDSLVNLSLAMTPVQQWNGEVELLIAKTSQQGFGVSHLRFTGRYLWLDDVIGDPVSLTTGISLTVPVETSQKDVSMGYHGDVEAELHVAVGKECTCHDTWLLRWWAVGQAGLANIGSPWLGFQANAEYNYCDTHQIRLFTKSLWGMGNKDINLVDTFQGYAHVDHRSVDVGVRYSHLICLCGTISVEYSNRLYTRNFPEDVHVFVFEFLYPFSL